MAQYVNENRRSNSSVMACSNTLQRFLRCSCITTRHRGLSPSCSDVHVTTAAQAELQTVQTMTLGLMTLNWDK